MAITHAGTAGTAASATSSSSFTLTTTTRACDASSNQFGLLLIASDNLGSSDGSNNEITSVTGGTGTWTKLGQWTNANGGAGNGVSVTLYYFEPSGGNAVGTVFTINLASAAVDKCAQFRVFAHGAGTAIRVDPTSSVQTNDGDAVNDIGSASFSGLASQARLYYRGFGKEANTISPVTPSTGFTQLSTNRSRNSAAAVCVGGEFRINTSTGETSNPTLAVSGDYASIFLALEEYTPGGGGDGNATGASLSNAYSLSPGAGSGIRNPTTTGIAISVSSSLSSGAASGGASAQGAALSVGCSIASGAATGGASAVGASLTKTLSLSGGAASGSANATGAAQSATITLSGGAASAGANGDAGGATLSFTRSLSGGAATGNASATGASLSTGISLSSGAASGNAAASGSALSIAYALVSGAGSSQGDGSAPGASLTIVTTLRAGRARGPIPPEAFGKSGRMWRPFAESFAA